MKIKLYILLLLLMLFGCQNAPKEPAPAIEDFCTTAVKDASYDTVFLDTVESAGDIVSGSTAAESDKAGETLSSDETKLKILSLSDHVKTNITDCEARKILAEMADLAAVYDISASYISGDGIFFCSIDGDLLYQSASTIKAVYCQYLLASGADMTEELLFDSPCERTSASGILTSDRRSERFKVSDLIEYTILYSDNMAYRLLFERFGIEGYNGWVKQLELDGLTFPDSRYEFFDVSADALSGGMLEILRWSENDPRLTDLMKSASFKLMALNTDYEVASKYGYEGGCNGYHDTGIIYAPKPYVLTVMTRMDANQEDAGMPFFGMVNLCDKLNRALYGYE